jgi:hypothetical protein
MTLEYTYLCWLGNGDVVDDGGWGSSCEDGRTGGKSGTQFLDRHFSGRRCNDGAIHYCIYKSRGRKLNPLMFPHRVTALHGIEQLTKCERNALIEANKQLPVHYSSLLL